MKVVREAVLRNEGSILEGLSPILCKLKTTGGGASCITTHPLFLCFYSLLSRSVPFFIG